MCGYLFLGILETFQVLNRHINLVDSQYRTCLLSQEAVMDTLECRCVAKCNTGTYFVVKTDI